MYWTSPTQLLRPGTSDDNRGGSRFGSRAISTILAFVARNLKYMRALAWPDAAIVQQTAAQLPWVHVCTLLDKVKNPTQRKWYASKAVEHGWSRQMLVMQVETRTHTRSGAALTNFDERLRARAITFFTVESGLVTKIVEFWPESYNSPFDRSEYAERLD